MRTASFFTARGPGRIAISLGIPKGYEGLPVYRPLAPASDLLAIEDEEFYERRYRAMLRKLDPARIVRELEALVSGHEPILLCWERPPFTETNWCHRRMAASWLHETLGLSVPEIEPPPPPPDRQVGLFPPSR